MKITPFLATFIVFIPTSIKPVIATAPFMWTSSQELTISYEQCKAKALEVAKFVLVEFGTEEYTSGFKVLGRTQRSRAGITCIDRQQDTVLIVGVTSYAYEEEGGSIRDRIVNFMSN